MADNSIEDIEDVDEEESFFGKKTGPFVNGLICTGIIAGSIWFASSWKHAKEISRFSDSYNSAVSHYVNKKNPSKLDFDRFNEDIFSKQGYICGTSDDSPIPTVYSPNGNKVPYRELTGMMDDFLKGR